MPVSLPKPDFNAKREQVVVVSPSTKSPFKQDKSGTRSKDLLKDKGVLERASRLGIASPKGKQPSGDVAKAFKEGAMRVDEQVTGKRTAAAAAGESAAAPSSSGGGLSWTITIGVPLVIIAAALGVKVAMSKSQQQ